MKNNNIENCLAFHDFNIDVIKLDKWLNEIIIILKKYDITLNKISSPSKTNYKNIDFKKGLANYKKSNFNTDNIWVGLHDKELGSEIFNSKVSAMINLKPVNYPEMVLCVSDEIMKLEYLINNKLLINLYLLIKPRYGYFFKRKSCQGPILYPSGFIAGNEVDDDEANLIDKWSKEYYSDGSYKTGDLRDIYPINILSEAHLVREIFPGKPFKEWVESSSKHGKLEKITEYVWSWEVNDDLISPVREALRPTGMILCI